MKQTGVGGGAGCAWGNGCHFYSGWARIPHSATMAFQLRLQEMSKPAWDYLGRKDSREREEQHKGPEVENVLGTFEKHWSTWQESSEGGNDGR